MYPPAQPERADSSQSVVAPSTGPYTQVLSECAPWHGVLITHRLVPPGAPKPAQAAVHNGRERTKEHGVEMWREGRGEYKQWRGGEGAAESHKSVDVRSDYQGPKDVGREYKEGRQYIG